MTDDELMFFDRDAHAKRLAYATQEALSVVYDVVFSTSGQHCVAATSLGELHWFDLEPLMRESYWQTNGDRRVTATRRFAHDANGARRVFCVAFLGSSDDVVVSGGDDGVVRAWSLMQDTSTNARFELRVPATTSLAATPEVNSLAVRADEHVFAGTGNGNVFQWDAQTQQVVRSYVGHSAYVHAVALAPSTGLLFSGADDGTVRMWDPRSGGSVASLALPRAAGTDARAVRAVAVSADGHWLAAGGDANAAGLWHTPSQQLVSVLPHAAAVGALCFVPGGLVSGDIGGSTLTHWNVDGSFRMRVATHATAVYTIAHNAPTQYQMLACAGMSTNVDVFFGNFAKRAFALSVVQ
jgi:WD40 repeat protein